MKNRILIILLLMLPLFTLSAESSTALSNSTAETLVAPLAYSVYNQDKQTSELEGLYNKVIEEIQTSSEISSRDKQFWEAQASYYMGKGLQNPPDMETVYEMDGYIRKGKFKKIQGLYTDIDSIKSYFEKSLSIMDDYLKDNRDARGVRLYAESLSQLSTLRSTGYLISVGPKIQPLAEESVELNPDETKAKILLASRYVYSPKIWGGNPDKGIGMLQGLLDDKNLSLQEKHDIIVGIGFAHTMAERWDQAVAFYKKALTIFPGNVFDKAMVSICLNGGKP